MRLENATHEGQDGDEETLRERPPEICCSGGLFVSDDVILVIKENFTS